MTHHLFKELGRAVGKEFDKTFDFSSSEPIIDWITGMTLKQLGDINSFVHRIRLAKILLKEKPDSKGAGIIRKQFADAQRNPKLGVFIKMISKYDIPSFRHVFF